MIPHRQTLIDMGWPQPKSPIQTDNSTASGGCEQHYRPSSEQDDGYALLVAPLPCFSGSVSLLLGCGRQKLGWLPHQTPPGYLPRIPQVFTCRHLGLDRHVTSTFRLTICPRVFPSGIFPFLFFCHLFPFSSILFAHIWDVAARVWRTPDSHYIRTVRINTHQALQTANTTNKCRPGAHRAPINKLGIDYHQYCSSSWLKHNRRRRLPLLSDPVTLEAFMRPFLPALRG